MIVELEVLVGSRWKIGGKLAGGEVGEGCNREIVISLVVEGVPGCARGGPGRAQAMAVGKSWLVEMVLIS